MSDQAGRFTTGSTMRHVAVMTLTGSLGLSFMFLVDFATLFYVSLLGNDTFTAGVGLAWAVQFFTISIGIGLAIATTALVSRAIGAREREKARRIATASILITTTLLTLIAVAVVIFRIEILSLLDATGDAAAVAERFLLISVPSLPFVGLAMIGSSILRAEGDARRSMMVTMCGGAAAMGLDPLFIFGFDLGVDGAAYAMVLSRMVSAGVGIYFCIKAHNLLARPERKAIAEFARPFAGIAMPATATQLSTPVGNFILTGAVAAYGDAAVAGWAIAGRVGVLAFGGIFALSGAIGGIIGQNYGAKLPDRVATAYRDSLIFASAYVASTALILILAIEFIITWFGAADEGAELLRAFAFAGSAGFIFAGMLFVANAAFNNLRKPLWSTGFNWARDVAAIPIALFLIGGTFGAAGVVYAQALAAVLVGVPAAMVGWRLARTLSFDEPKAGWTSTPAPPTSSRAATSVLSANKVED